MPNYWLIKSEPFKYPWSQLLKDGLTFWDGVRNYQARNYLRDMREGDLCLFYHSNEGKEVVGVARIVSEAYQDPTDATGQWSVVDLAPAFELPQPVSLDTLRSHPELQKLNIFRQMRLSVVAVEPDHFELILALGGIKTNAGA